jgi:hypothetical protein
MSDHEFDTYLALLTSLLRLDGKQRGRIADELRSHLEDRLEELTERGLPREEAIGQALVEFGDAAGLAAEFRSLSWNRKRRWIMRVTTFSAAATLLIAAGIITFWPGTNAGPGIAQVAAQNEEAKADKSEDKPAEKEANDSQKITLEEKLNQRIDVEFVELPLKDVFDFLQSNTGIQFYVNAKRLEEAGVSTDSPVTSTFRQIKLSTWLDIALDELELTYLERDDIVVITTPEDAETKLIIRVYDCRDLLSMPWPAAEKKPAKAAARAGNYGSGGSGYGDVYGAETPGAQASAPGTIVTPLPDGGGFGGRAGDPPSNVVVPREIMPQLGGGGFGGSGGGLGESGGEHPRSPAPPPTEHERRVERLISLITTNVDGDSWDEVGGPGSISEYGGLIVITQTAQTHKKVERVLEMLREAAGNAPLIMQYGPMPTQQGGGGFF